jgi:cytochrome c
MRKLLSALILSVVASTPLNANESEQVANGKALYGQFCQRCHGADGQRGEGTRTPIWGPGAPKDKFATVQQLFEYLQFLMPFDKPDSVSDEQRWDIIAYMMVQHGAIKPSDTVDPAKAAAITITLPSGAAAPSEPAPSTDNVALGSADSGAEIFKQCRSCHEVGPDAKHRQGPALNGLVGRQAGTYDGFPYSPANRAAGEKGLIWTEVELSSYLTSPRKYMPGNRMAFVGLADERDRADLIAFLKRFSK